MNKLITRAAALTVVATFFLAGFLLFNPLGESSINERDSKITNRSPLPNSLLPAVAKSFGRDDPSYHINSVDNTHSATTPRQGLETEFGAEGVFFKTDDDSLKLELSKLGRADQLSSVDQISQVVAEDNRLQYKRGNVTEWYVNSPLGMEQGFTISQRPEGSSELVNVVLGLDMGNLNASESANGKSIQFTNSKGQEVMTYSKLYVYDAQGKELESSMKVSEEKIIIAYNDTGAQYPVVVDPLMEVQRILASNGNDDDEFGFCSAVYDTYAVVGAPFKGRGYAYMFERDMAGMWNEVAVWRGQNFGASSGADFGRSCDVAGTSDFGAGLTAFAVIGAPGDDIGSGFAHGSAFIFERDGSGNWSFAQNIRASSIQTLAFFGADVAITQEGYVLSGAPAEDWNGPSPCDADRGAAYYYERGGSWPSTQTQRVTASDSTCFDYFGTATGLDGVFSIIGAPFWDDSFGDDEGAVYAFERSGTWTQNGGAINPSQVGNFDHFGESADVYTGAISTSAIAGAPDANYNGPGSDTDRGEAYILERTGGGSWTTNITRLRADDPQGGAEFGFCVGIYGEYAIAGAPFEDIDFDGGGDSDVGAAYVYKRAAVNSWPFEQKLTASDMNNPDRFAYSCDFDDLTTAMPYTPLAIAGAPRNDIDGEDDQGAAYLFEGEQNGEITIVKQTIPAFPTVFSFEGSMNLPIGNPCEAFDLSNGEMQECGPLPADTYTITETVINDATVNVNCLGGTWTPIENGVEIDLASGDDITCTFTNILPLELSPLFPSIRNLSNSMTASQATPGGQVAFFWGFELGTTIIGGPTCNGLELGINPLIFLGLETADVSGAAEMVFFVPSLAGVNPVYAQAVDIDTCRASEVVESILTTQ